MFLSLTCESNPAISEILSPFFGKDLEKEAKEDQAENDKMESRLAETDGPVLRNHPQPMSMDVCADVCTEAGAKRPKRIRPGGKKAESTHESRCYGKIDLRFSLQPPCNFCIMTSNLTPM